MPVTKVLTKFIQKDRNFHLNFSILIRLILLSWSIYQDANFKVKFTDVDYHVFNGAAKHVYAGNSPYQRHTYRYTPLLAYSLVPGFYLGIEKYFGKIIFIVADIYCGKIIYKITQTYKFSYLIWLYNPITLAVSVRGNSESLIVLVILYSLNYLLEAVKDENSINYQKLVVSSCLIRVAPDF